MVSSQLMWLPIMEYFLLKQSGKKQQWYSHFSLMEEAFFVVFSFSRRVFFPNAGRKNGECACKFWEAACMSWFHQNWLWLTIPTPNPTNKWAQVVKPQPHLKISFNLDQAKPNPENKLTWVAARALPIVMEQRI